MAVVAPHVQQILNRKLGGVGPGAPDLEPDVLATDDRRDEIALEFALDTDLAVTVAACRDALDEADQHRRAGRLLSRQAPLTRSGSGAGV